LGALELRTRIEIAALLATVQLEIAFRTFPAWIEAGHKYRAAIRTARSGYRPHHPRGSRTKMIRSASGSALRRLAIPVFLFVFFLLFGITIAAVTVLAIHKRLRPSVSTDCNLNFLHYWFNTWLFPKCIQSERF
jgi:hypothetical protein